MENKEQILSVGEVIKSNSSYRNWVVPYDIYIPIGNRRITNLRFFFKKKDATKWVEEQKKLLTEED